MDSCFRSSLWQWPGALRRRWFLSGVAHQRKQLFRPEFRAHRGCLRYNPAVERYLLRAWEAPVEIFGLGFFSIALIIIALYALSSIKILAEYERAVIFRFGRLYHRAKGPGV